MQFMMLLFLFINFLSSFPTLFHQVIVVIINSFEAPIITHYTVHGRRRINMADAVVQLALQELTSLITENARFLSGVKDEVEEITAELKRMQLFLRDADSRNHKDGSVRHWLREIRLLAYRVEDIVETFAVEVASNGRRGVLRRFACIVCEAKSLRSFGLKIAKAKTDINKITTSLQRYDIKAIEAGTGSSSGNEYQWWRRQTYAHQIEEHFVGMEEDMKKLLSLVLDDKRHHVISTVGMGGLGKTTFTRKIYRHIDVQRYFGRFAWVCITQQAQIKDILQDILMQLAPEKMGQMSCRELVQQIYQAQKMTKCLVVLDDIWRSEDWESLVAAFPIAEGDSKILLTTRNKKIAEIGFPYALKCLTEKESWELLQKIASPRENIEDFKTEQKLEDVGIEMVRKCGGLPLAISVLGGILKDKNSLTEWQMVNKCISSYLSNVEDDREEGGAVARVLSLSYDDLPYYLKPCFLYLASFREDEEIEVVPLYLLWEAEGMILSQHQRSEEGLLDVAERYLNELARRSMVQVKPNDYMISSKFHSCSLHDMVRDLCLEKGREEEFSKVIDFRGVRQSSLDPSSSTNFSCRLVIHMDIESAIKARTGAQEKCKQLRSLRCLNLDRKLCQKEIVGQQGIVNLDDSKSLRVLQFQGYDFQGNKLPVDLRKLIHLRYLNVNNCKLDELPSSVAELPFLHTLHVQVNNEIKVPNALWKMKKLRRLHLFTNGRHTGKGKLRLHGLDELEVLFGVDSRTDEISDLSNLLSLQKFLARVCDNNSLHHIIDYINTKGLKLKETAVCIDGCDFVSLTEGYVLLRKVLMCDKLHHLGLLVKINKFPRYEPSLLQNLIGLFLEGNKIEEDPIETLEMLPQLRLLFLGSDCYMGKDMTFHEWGFPQLRILHVDRLSKLECWKVERGALPNLGSLMILGCQKLEMIPEGLKFVVNLEKLVIYEMPVKFCDRIKIKDTYGRKGDDYDKIQHVASISIDRPVQLYFFGSASLHHHLFTFLVPECKYL